MQRLTKKLPALLFAGSIAVLGAACSAEGGGNVEDPGVLDPAEDPLAPTDDTGADTGTGTDETTTP